MKRITMLLVVSLLACSVRADDAGYQPLIDRFFAKFEKGKTDDAVEELYGTNKWGKLQRQQVQIAKNELAALLLQVGEYRGRELIGAAMVGGRLVHVTYMVLYDKTPLRFEFALYRPEDTWMMYSFSFDNKLPDELETGARVEIARGGN